ncbi:MAG TPA: DUF3810 domain-containing protein [Flavisolibacter sp.]|nr:DUF3810 domain-containing protein [Flavisolibacter sp.]
MDKDFNESAYKNMVKSLLRDRLLLFLLSLALLIKLFSLDGARVEHYYTYGLYPWLSRTLRVLLGWLPFSLGDLLYISAFIYLVAKVWKFLRILAKRQLREYLGWVLLRKFLRLVAWIYIIFNLFWGLNYNRLGIAHQLALDVKPYTLSDLRQVTGVLEQRLNACAALTDSAKRLQLNQNRQLFAQGILDYRRVKAEFPFLSYASPSIKASIFSPVGHYFGFSGYFNPFTGEAQLNTNEPVFLKPFVLNHEIAHQLGYGKENEASFVSYLSARRSDNIDFRYSIYYELFFSAVYECAANGDTTIGTRLRRMHPRVLADREEHRTFRIGHSNRVQPYVTRFYDNYLRLNNQPKGMATYNQVIAWLIAYLKKNGEQEL